MFVTKKQLRQELGAVREQVNNLHAVLVEAIGEEKFTAIQNKINEPLPNFLDDDDLLPMEGFDFEEAPVAVSTLHPVEVEDKPAAAATEPAAEQPAKKKMPSRLEYEERVDKAIKLFMQRKTRSQVQKMLDVSEKTARTYLRKAIAKRKVKKADYEALNK